MRVPIHCDPHVMGGQPVIAGTRIPSQAIWFFWQAGVCIGAIAREYPGLAREQLWAAILFEHRRRSISAVRLRPKRWSQATGDRRQATEDQEAGP